MVKSEIYEKRTQELLKFIDTTVAWHKKAIELSRARVWSIEPANITIEIDETSDYKLTTVKDEDLVGNVTKLELKVYKNVNKAELTCSYKGNTQAYMKEEEIENGIKVEVNYYDPESWGYTMEIHVPSGTPLTSNTPIDITTTTSDGKTVSGTITLQDGDPDYLHQLASQIPPREPVRIAALNKAMIGALLPEDGGENILMRFWDNFLKFVSIVATAACDFETEAANTAAMGAANAAILAK